MKVRAAILHESTFVESVGNIKTNVNKKEMPALSMTLNEAGTLVLCEMKGVKFALPVTGFKSLTLE